MRYLFVFSPLHHLSQVTDARIMAPVILCMQQCGVLNQCINLRNKMQQVSTFLNFKHLISEYSALMKMTYIFYFLSVDQQWYHCCLAVICLGGVVQN